MRRLPALLPLMLWLGCAASTPNLSLRVEPSRTARLAPEVLQKVEAASVAPLREIDRELEVTRQRVASLRKALSAARAEPVAQETKEVHAAKIERADRELKWEESLERTAEWRRAVLCAVDELAKAETLSRAGDNIDVAAYSAQQDRMRAGLNQAVRDQALTRARFDDAERLLSAAKARYAQSHASR
jgi:hypothetical protein